jgi:hypothetical protein
MATLIVEMHLEVGLQSDLEDRRCCWASVHLAPSRSTLVRFAPWQMAACWFAWKGEAALCSKVLNLISSVRVLD